MVPASNASSTSSSTLGRVNVCMSESDPDSLRALPVSLPQVIPLTPNPRQFLNSVTSCSSLKAGPSPAIRNVVGGYQTEGNQQGYYEWAPQV